MSRTPRVILPLAAALLAVAAPAPATASAAKPRFERIAGFASPGTPAKYNRVGILEVGSPKARNVLVLNPGTSSSSAYFAPLAKSLVAEAPDWQVWAVERRENLLEDHSMFDKLKAGKATVKRTFDYYLGWLDDSSITDHFKLIGDSDVGYARDWGLNTEIQDLRRVVVKAEKLGGKVVVGGHSLGGTITTAYATWDFDGQPGAKGLSGLVYIDGASGNTPITAGDAQQRLDTLQTSTPWLTIGGIPAPFTGLFNTAGALAAIVAPNEPSLASGLKALPAELKPPVTASNRGQYGFALDTATSPKSLALAQGHLGHLAKSGTPRGWVDDDELTPLERFAEAFSGWGLKSLDGTAWYHPTRLSLDAGSVGNGIANDAQPILAVHATRGRDLPKSLRIYAFGAALGGQRVLDSTKALAKQSGIPSSRLVLVDRQKTYAHNDPNTAAPDRNDFLKKLVPFLARVAK